MNSQKRIRVSPNPKQIDSPSGTTDNLRRREYGRRRQAGADLPVKVRTKEREFRVLGLLRFWI